MGRFKNVSTGVIFSVADSKNGRYAGVGFADPDAAEPSKYDAMSKADLVAEVEKRNEGRDDDAKLSASGNKPDLAAALAADDDNSN